MADPREINYAGNQVIYNKEMTDQKIEAAVTAEQQRATTAENTLATAIDNEVTRATEAEELINSKLEEEIERAKAAETRIDNKVGDTATLETVDKSSTVAAINELVQKIPETDEAPIEGSDKIAKSGGTWNAIRFASVKVGETMYWHLQDNSSPEDREVHSDNPFMFNFNGQEISVETHDGHVQLCVLKDIPDGWHALDGKAELDAADYPDLVAFMPENVTTDGKIWLPYVQHKIIKVKY